MFAVRQSSAGWLVFWCSLLFVCTDWPYFALHSALPCGFDELVTSHHLCSSDSVFPFVEVPVLRITNDLPSDGRRAPWRHCSVQCTQIYLVGSGARLAPARPPGTAALGEPMYRCTLKKGHLFEGFYGTKEYSFDLFPTDTEPFRSNRPC